MFESRRNKSAHTGYRILLWMLVVTVAAGVHLNNVPIVLEADIERAEGTEITRQANSDVLIVLDYEAIRNSGPEFEQRDFSVAWINLFEQELGPISIATPASLSQEVLEESRVVVLTASVSNQVPEALLERLRRQALDGAIVVVERPEGPLREAFSANGRAGTRRGQQITFARGMTEPYETQLLEMPLSTEFVGSTAPKENATTHMSIDGAPAIYAAPIGKGTAITIDFDLGEQLVALQQGRPRSDFTLAAPHRQQVPRTSALIMASELQTSAVPYADLLERFIAHGVIGSYTPVAGFWPFPGGANGALIAVHEDRALGDGGGWMLEYEVDNRAVSTLLSTVDSGLSASGAAIIGRMGGEMGLAWKKEGTPLEIDERVGLWGFEPFARPVSLEDQLDDLKETLPVNYVRSARIADSWWDTHWSRPFEIMAAQNLRVDTSYSPAPGSGYGFGTGFPFLVVNAKGMPLGMREMPVVYPSSATDGPRLADLIELSSQGHHQAITWSVDSEVFADYPDMERFEQWLEVFEIARQHEHIITSVDRFDRFLRSRRAGRIQSRLVTDAKLPKTRSNAPSEKTSSDQKVSQAGSATLLRLTVEAKRSGKSVIVPARVGDKAFRMARRSASRMAGQRVSGSLETVPATLVGYEFRRIPLDAGFNSIDVYYR